MNESSRCVQLPPEVVEAFSAAAITALQELVQVAADLDPAPPPPGADAAACVRAVVRLVRPIPGELTLLLSAETAADLARRYLPQGAPLTEAMTEDVIGEFANVIAGQAKTALQGTPYHFLLSLPRVDRTQTVPAPPAAGAFALWFESGCLRVYLDLAPCENA